MTDRFKPIDLNQVKTYRLSERKSKVSTKDFAKIWRKGAGFTDFFDSLPDILAGKHIKGVISAVVTAFKNNKTVVFAMGAHVIKVGLGPIVIDLMERKVITAVAMNGAGIIHDLELAMIGQTSEDVDTAIEDGSFGMADETCAVLSQAVSLAGRRSTGLGDAVGRTILASAFPHQDQSILAAGVRLGIPVTVHVAIGTDIIHMHPGFDARETGAATHKDFRKFASVIATLEGGVFLNIGSAVIMPEVFLKALTLARNLGCNLQNFTSVNMDFINQYRPLTNVVKRPTGKRAQGFNLIGHHEIMLPLIAAGIVEQMS
jgi:deoxyhypusine synthase